MTTPIDLADASARCLAVDPTRSCLVRAPAGSGKTELLIQRFLALLATVQRPDAILAITFTRKAAAEMRQRVLDALLAAQQPLPDEAGEHQRTTYRLASAVLQRNKTLAWNLFDHPQQLQIQTIDSFNATLVARMPWLSRLGGLPAISDQPYQLYRQAVRQLLAASRTTDQLNRGLLQLQHHLDNRSDRLEELLVQLLERRDQWLRHLFGEQVRARDELQQALEAVLAEQLAEAARAIPLSCRDDLMALGRFAAEQLADDQRPLSQLLAAQGFPETHLDALPVWRGLAELLLTSEGQWRKTCNKNIGFPAGKKEPFASMKQRMLELLSLLSDEDSQALAQVVTLPSGGYSERQWQTLEALLDILPALVAQLWWVFRQSGEVDFTEVALKARQALVDSGQPTEQLLTLDRQIDHILVDEFQDTSWLQFDLLTTLVSGWQPDDGRTLFVVGDPMQSIYRFREAEVGLFLQAGQQGIGPVRLQSLQLSANFRSQQGIVATINRWFPEIFPAKEDAGRGAVCYSQAQPVLDALTGDAVTVYPGYYNDPEGEAVQVVDRIKGLRQCSPSQSIAVLVRSRTHLKNILSLLQAHAITYQAQDIDVLTQRPVVSDLTALTKALLHGGDDLSWLTVLRAPWCGVTLNDLIHFAPSKTTTVAQLATSDAVLSALPSASQQRVAAVVAIVTQYRYKRGQVSLRQLVESCWWDLDGPCYYGPQSVDDAEPFLRLLDRLDYGGDLLAIEQLDDHLQQLYAAPAAHCESAVQVMTIHKAKGLEFDHVILPGLGRKPRRSDQPLMRWLEHPAHGLLMAPITAPGDTPDPIYGLLGQLEQRKEDYEVARLLYVALTRARRTLHLFGQAALNRDGRAQPASGSLLATLWPAIGAQFVPGELDVSEDGEDLAVERCGPPLLRRAEPLSVVPLAMAEADGVTPWSSGMIASHVGTLVHHWFERFAADPQAIEDYQQAQKRTALICRQVRLLGLAERHLEQTVDRINLLIDAMLSSDRGRWILAPHQQGRNEYALSGELDGQLVSVIIDRTFVEGTDRWVIDYKTSVPGALSMEQFYQRQAEMYAEQLERYARLIGRLDPEHRCRCALYFPACDGWYELDFQEGTNGREKRF
ncbi:UvrD-helicase domain-containing protein [uncultured Desulfuromonas sp.]|uniref:UvrD-helicase domain-containing protein n=1 Tax=uncultured Desulfuromonas sp. TaxID=181013 RepID=UPI002AAC3A95|nr:UvrD-helicase domain-containing protein [uncultured Desulfuromonas sp.]